VKFIIKLSGFFKNKLVRSFLMLIDTSGLESHENLSGIRVGIPKRMWNENSRSWMAIAPWSLLSSHPSGQSAWGLTNPARTPANNLKTRFSTG
jgi:hypothetical protein